MVLSKEAKKANNAAAYQKRKAALATLAAAAPNTAPTAPTRGRGGDRHKLPRHIRRKAAPAAVVARERAAQAARYQSMKEAVALLAAAAAVVEEVLAMAPYSVEQALEEVAGQGAAIPLPYTGSKKDVGQEIAAFIHSTMRQQELGEFYDVTHGAGGVTMHITARTRHASDINADVIAFFKALVSHTYTLEHVTAARFKYLKANPVPGGSAERAVAAFVFSVRAQCFMSYHKKRKNLHVLWERMQQSRPLFEGVNYTCASYEQCQPAPGSVVYADPPYKTNPGHCNGWKRFDHALFWQWVRDLSVRGVFVFVSEVSAPGDFDVVWKKRVTRTFKRTEKVFMHSSLRQLLANR